MLTKVLESAELSAQEGYAGESALRSCAEITSSSLEGSDEA